MAAQYGTRINLYNNAGGSKDNDWAVIKIMNIQPSFSSLIDDDPVYPCIGSFNTNVEKAGEYSLTYHDPKYGLDRWVSRVEVKAPF